MDAHRFLENLALALCAAAVTAVVSRRLKLPVVFGYVAAGMLVGPFTPTPTADPEVVRMLSDVGVVLLMFSVGIEFQVGRLLRVATTSGPAALAETSAMFGLGYTAGAMFGWTSMESLVAGAMVAISSTTIVARTFGEQRVEGTVRQTVFGILIIEDVVAILLIAMLSTMVSGTAMTGKALATAGLQLATFLIVLTALGRLTVPRLVRAVHAMGSQDTTVVVSVGLSFAFASLALVFGYSVALGAFIAGSLVAESGLGEQVAQLTAPVRDLFVALFFVSVGMAIDPSLVRESWVPVVAFTMLVVVGKVIAVTLGAFLTGHSLRDSIQSGMSLAQIGEFSFIIAAVGATNDATRPFLYPVAVTVSALTTLLTPWLVRISGDVAARADRRLPPALQTFVALYGSWFARLGNRGSDVDGVRRAVWLIAVDVALLIGLVTAAAAEMTRLAVLIETWLGWQAPAGRIAVVALALVGAAPFVAGLVRVTRLLASRLALRAMPAPAAGALDRAFAPRAAFIATLHLALLVVCSLPVVAVLTAVAPGVLTLGAVLLLVTGLLIAVWRSARVLYGHARAGAEVIVMALTQHDRTRGSDEDLELAMDRVSSLLPGLGDPEPLRLRGGDYGVGRTLSELNLRGATGANVVAILRVKGETVSSQAPTGHERLYEGDVLAIAGSPDAVQQARALLVSGH